MLSNPLQTESLAADLIIGRATIKKLSLVLEIPSQFHNMGKVLITEGITSEHATKCSGCQPKEDLLPSKSIPKGPPLVSQLKNPTVTQTSRILASLVRESEQLSRAPLYDDDNIDHYKTDTFKPWSSPSSNNDILSLIHFSGDMDLQSRLRTLCTDFSDIFSNDLPKEPANIPPFNLIVDNLKLKVGKNRAPLRTQSAVKQTELFNTIQALISQGTAEKYQSPHYNQRTYDMYHLVLEPSGFDYSVVTDISQRYLD